MGIADSVMVTLSAMGEHGVSNPCLEDKMEVRGWKKPFGEDRVL